MNKPHRPIGWNQFPLLVISFLTALTFSSIVFGQPEKAILDKSSAGSSQDKISFGSGFDSSTPSWSQWRTPAIEGDGPQYENLPAVTHEGPVLKPLDAYKVSPNENPFDIALKINDMLGGLSGAVADYSTGDAAIRSLPQSMMSISDGMMAKTDAMYADLRAMYGSIDSMKAQLTRNYETFNNSDKTEEIVGKFNSQSDAMADRVGGMRISVAGMTQRVTDDLELLDGMFEILDDLNGSNNKAQAGDQLAKHIKDVSGRFEAMVRELKGQGLEGASSVEAVRQYLAGLTQYAKDVKAYNASAIDFTVKVRSYLKNIQDYLNRVLEDLKKTDEDLKANEDYFRNAKVHAEGNEIAPPEKVQDLTDQACASSGKPLKKGEKEKPLSSLQTCQKDCRTVCRYKEDRNGQKCYECPSGSPDSCADVGGQPANFSWCQPGGICYDDPNMVCQPFGAVGPQGEHLQCTNCKERPDECWQKVGQETTNLTHCIQRCWNGTCVYKGKYKEQEWDGKPEFMHCYECKTPPGPPSCEDLGWGFTWKSDCEKACPAPGICESKNTQVPGGPNPPNNPPNNPPGGPGQDCGGGVCGGVQGGGQTDNPQGGGQSGGGHTVSGGQPQGGTDGTNPNPPTGGANPPTSGGGTTAQGGPTQAGDNQTPGGTTEQGQGTKQEPGQAPTTTSPNQPQQPNTGDKPKPPDAPPAPPSTPEIDFYQKWLTETKERIKSREDIINNPNEGDTVKDEARRQLDGMNWWKEYLETRIKKLQDDEAAKIKAQEDFKKKQEEWQRTRPRTRDYAAEARRRGEEYKLKKLKEATDALKTKLQEMKDAITGRREHLDRIQNEIKQLESENAHFTQSRDQNGMDKDFANTRIKQNQDRINELKKLYNELAKKLQEAQKKFTEELEPLRKDYQRALWAVDEGSRRRAEAQRIDEYFELWDELKRKEQMREVRRETFESMVKSLEGARDEARAKGDSSAADEFQRQIDNIKRGQAEWDATQERQINTLKDQIRDIENRNIYEGVGPGSPEDLGKKLGEYEKIFQDKLAAAQNKISELEKLSTRSAEQDKQLQALRSQAQGLQGAIDGVHAKQEVFKNGSQLTAEERQRVHDTATRVANGAMNTDADKSFARLAAESIAEEAVHNLNPYVMAKKSLAFGVGVVQGVGTAVGGLVKLGWEAIDTVGEAVMVDLGFNEGGIFGTENLDAINGMVSTVSSNANFDGVIKAVVAAGGAIDAKIKELEKGDIDWNTSQFGGQVYGEYVLGNEVIAAGLGKAASVIKGTEEVAEVTSTTGKVTGAVDEAATATTAVDDAAGVGRTVERAGEVPRSPSVETPQPRGPPEGTVVKPGETPSAPTRIEPRPGETPSAPTQIEPRPATTVRPGETPSAPTRIEPAPGETPSAPTKIEPQPGTVVKPGETPSAPTRIEPAPGETPSAPTKLEPQPGTVVKPGETPSAPTKIEPQPGTVVKPGETPSAPTKVEPPPAGAKPAAAAADAAEASKTAQRLERAGIDEFSEASYVGPDGQKVTVKVGEELGHGSTSTVFADPNDPTKAIRITKPGGLQNSGSPRAAQLDAAGRRAVEGIQRPGGPITIVKPGTPVMVTDPASPLNGKIVEVVERLENGSADKFLASQGGRMTPGQAEAFANATKELNQSGYAWMDNHTGNYGFKPIDAAGDKWQVVVLDPGGIVPMSGGNMAERIENATALQKALNAPDEATVQMFNEANKARKNTIVRLQRGQIMTDFADKIDTFAMGFKDPYEIGFYPAGTWAYPEVQNYFK